jgi:selenocysteine lyase/cysteine desulfurase
MDRIEQHDKALGHYFMNEVRKIPGITVLGPNQSADQATFYVRSPSCKIIGSAAAAPCHEIMTKLLLHWIITE